MNALTVVMQRELKERRSVIMAATVFGLLPPFILFAGKVRGQDATELAAVIALIATASMFFGVAAAAGSSMLSRELAEKRLAFYFGRPVSGLSIWGGKVLAAIVLPLIAGSIPLLIATLFGIPFLSMTSLEDEPGAMALGVAAMLFLIVLSHALTLGVRARSPWMGLEVATFALAIGMMVNSARGMFMGGATEFVGYSFAYAIVGVIASLLIAGAAGIMRGRSEIVVVQRYTAIAFASIIMGLAVFYAAYTAWVRSADPSDLRLIDARGAVAGPLIAVRGRVAGGLDYQPTFLVNTSNGKRVPVTAVLSPVRFSESGRAVWDDLTFSFTNPRMTMMWADLNEADPRPHPTTLDTTGKEASMSPSGKRVSITDGNVIAFYDVRSEEQIAAMSMPKHEGVWFHHLMWVNDGLVRLYIPTDRKPDADSLRTWMIYELSLPAKSVKNVGTFRGRGIGFMSDRKKILSLGTGVLQVVDAVSGAQLASLPLRVGPNRVSHVAVGSRIAVLEFANEKYVRVFNTSGGLEREIKVPASAGKLSVGPEADTVLFGGIIAKEERATFIVNLVSGTVESYAEGATPISSSAAGFHAYPEAGSAVTRLLANSEQIFEYDRKSGKRRVIGGRS